MSDDEKPRPMHPATVSLLAMAYGLGDSLPRHHEGSECDRCHQRGFHASGCWYVLGWASQEHYRHCKKCKPGLEVDGPGVLCPRGKRLHDKAKAASTEGKVTE